MKKFSIYIVGILILLLIGLSFGYYSFRVKGTPTGITLTAGKLRIHFVSSNYINTTTAAPILAEDVITQSEVNYFSIQNNTNSYVYATIILEDIVIADELKSSSFKYRLYSCTDANDTSCTTSLAYGDFVNCPTTKTINTYNIIDANSTKYFAFRIWLEDDGSDQTSMMGKTMTSKIAVTE